MSVHTAGWDGSNPVEHDDLLDSRDIIARIEWLTDQLDAARDGSPLSDDATEAEQLADEYSDELAELQAFDGSEAEDWEYGETFIADDYFETYAEEFASDIGAVNSEAEWPVRHIDWEAAAEELQQDYTSYDLTLNGVTRTYWAR